MLKGIDPLLRGDLLHLLDSMGHGDILTIVDRNFPAARYGKPVISVPGVGTAAAARAIFSVFPIDSYVDTPIERMELDARPLELTDVASTVLALATEAEGREIEMSSIERQEFYRRAAESFAFVHTGETVGYSNFFIRKGVV